MLTTRRQSSRLAVRPCFAASASTIRQLSASLDGPPGRPAPIDSIPTPYFPAAWAPAGVVTLATAIGKPPLVQGRRCSRASRSSNQSVFMVTGSRPSSSATMAPSDSSMRRRCVSASIPIM